MPSCRLSAALLAIAEANAKSIRQVAESIEAPGGLQAVNLKVGRLLRHVAPSVLHAKYPFDLAFQFFLRRRP